MVQIYDGTHDNILEFIDNNNIADLYKRFHYFEVGENPLFGLTVNEISNNFNIPKKVAEKSNKCKIEITIYTE